MSSSTRSVVDSAASRGLDLDRLRRDAELDLREDDELSLDLDFLRFSCCAFLFAAVKVGASSGAMICLREDDLVTLRRDLEGEDEDDVDGEFLEDDFLEDFRGEELEDDLDRLSDLDLFLLVLLEDSEGLCFPYNCPADLDFVFEFLVRRWSGQSYS